MSIRRRSYTRGEIIPIWSVHRLPNVVIGDELRGSRAERCGSCQPNLHSWGGREERVPAIWLRQRGSSRTCIRNGHRWRWEGYLWWRVIPAAVGRFYRRILKFGFKLFPKSFVPRDFGIDEVTKEISEDPSSKVYCELVSTGTVKMWKRSYALR